MRTFVARGVCGAVSSVQIVCPCASCERVSIPAAVEIVVASPAVECIDTPATIEIVITPTTNEGIFAIIAPHQVCRIITSCRNRCARNPRQRKPSQICVAIAVVQAVATTRIGRSKDCHRVLPDRDDHIASSVAREGKIAATRRIPEVEFVDRSCCVVFIASDRVCAIAASEDINVRARTTFQNIVACAARKRVCSRFTIECINAITAVELVVVRAAVEKVAIPVSINLVVACPAVERVDTPAAVHSSSPRLALELVGFIAA